MSTIEVNVKISDLEYVRYEYWANGFDLYLDKVYILTRETTRHKLKVDFRNSWSRLTEREFGIKEAPDAPIEVDLEAQRIARSMITVKKWETR